jgi:hypothetical protein
MLRVTVGLYNDNTGHKIPTDSPLRQMLLIVEVLDQEGATLALLDGPTLPDWAGVGDPAEGYYATRPGKAYALILQELWTEISPSAAYWNPTRVVEDTRLQPFQEDFSSYTFSSRGDGELQVHVLMDQKGWTDADMLIAEQVLTVSPP